MRFISKLTMTVAAIFFALSVSAHAGGHDTTSNSLGSKIYQVCKKWRVDQGGWMATDQMQHCRKVLLCAATGWDGMRCSDYELGLLNGSNQYDASDVDSNARNAAKSCLQDGSSILFQCP